MKNKSIARFMKATAGLMTAVVLTLSTVVGCGKTGDSTINPDKSENITSDNSSDAANSEAEISGEQGTDSNAGQAADQISPNEDENGSENSNDGSSNKYGIDFSKVSTPANYPEYVLCEENAKLIGRNYMYEDELWCALSGSGAEFIYYGSKLDITFLSDDARSVEGSMARIAVYVDGERVLDKMLNKKSETFTVYEGAKDAVVVQIVKLSEAASSTCGISPITVAEGEYIIPTEAKAHRIEFIGDSITCGYGVDDEVKEHHFSTATEDVTRAWAYKVAQTLDADYSIFSYSGWGVVSGYTGDANIKSDRQLVPAVYDKLAFSYQCFAGKIAPQDIQWDFADFQPEAVVINLGTNDASYCNSNDKKLEFTNGYVEFLKKIRMNNPDAHIFCALGTMGDAMYSSVKSAVQIYTDETGDTKVSTIALPNQNSSDGFAADWHPTEKTHDKAAGVAANEIKKVMGW